MLRSYPGHSSRSTSASLLFAKSLDHGGPLIILCKRCCDWVDAYLLFETLIMVPSIAEMTAEGLPFSAVRLYLPGGLGLVGPH